MINNCQAIGKKKMGLFFEVLQAINNPNQQASTGELSNVVNSVEELAHRQGIDPSTMQSVMSAIGEVLRPTLQQQRVASGAPDLGNLVGQLTSGGMGETALSSLLSPQMIEAVSQKTGLNASTLQGMLPALLPSVLSLLRMGETQPGIPRGNPLLNSFLDGDRDGDVDLGDIYQFARRFLNSPRPN